MALLKPQAGAQFELALVGTAMDLSVERVRVVTDRDSCGASGTQNNDWRLGGNDLTSSPDRGCESGHICPFAGESDPNATAAAVSDAVLIAWTNLTLASALDGARYRVCWCPVSCTMPGDFLVLAGDFDVEGIVRLAADATTQHKKALHFLYAGCRVFLLMFSFLSSWFRVILDSDLV